MSRRHKYRAQPTEIDGIRFDSKREATYYASLKVRQIAGEIDGLELQPRYDIYMKGKKVCTYVADFRFNDKVMGKRRVVDVKGFKTQVYKLKKKLAEAAYPGLEIEEA